MYCLLCTDGGVRLPVDFNVLPERYLKHSCRQVKYLYVYDGFQRVMVVVLVCMWYTHCSIAVFGKQAEEESLISVLFTGYNAAARPVLNASEAVDLKLHYLLNKIEDLVNIKNSNIYIFNILVLVKYSVEVSSCAHRESQN